MPGPGQILVDISAAGVNFMDTGARRPGTAASRPVPFVPGVEAAGSVRELGAGVTDFAVDDRVAWVYAYGTYAQQIALPALAEAAQAHRDLESRATTGKLLLLP